MLPESGYNGEYDRKEAHYMIKSGKISDMIHDSGILLGSDFDKIIPCYEDMNCLLKQGSFARLVEWDPIVIDSHEYNEVVEILLAMSMDRPYRLSINM